MFVNESAVKTIQSVTPEMRRFSKTTNYRKVRRRIKNLRDDDRKFCIAFMDRKSTNCF